MNGPRIAVVCPRLQLPDAVGYDVMHQVRVLREAGYDARAFAESASAATPAGTLRDVRSFLKAREDVLLYHYSVHAGAIFELWRELNCCRILRYHNVTPPHFFEPYDRGYTKALRAGREMLAAHLATGVDLVISASRENLTDVLEVGTDPAICAIVPPFHRVPELLAGDPDPDWLIQLGPEFNRPIRNLLAVGRIVPNKGYAALLRGFAALKNPPARLILVGGQNPRLSTYYRELRSIIEETRIASRVWLPGSVSLAALRAMYRRADLLVTTSEHEGFCLPLLEAMAHGVVPAVTRVESGVGEWIEEGVSGITAPVSEPEALARKIAQVAHDRGQLVHMGAMAHTRVSGSLGLEQMAERYASIFR